MFCFQSASVHCFNLTAFLFLRKIADLSYNENNSTLIALNIGIVGAKVSLTFSAEWAPGSYVTPVQSSDKVITECRGEERRGGGGGLKI
jgi:hypothetical protein